MVNFPPLFSFSYFEYFLGFDFFGGSVFFLLLFVINLFILCALLYDLHCRIVESEIHMAKLNTETAVMFCVCFLGCPPHLLLGLLEAL